MMTTDRVLVGRGATSMLRGLLDKCLVKKVFLISGKASYELLANRKTIDDSLIGYEVRRYSDFDVNPNYTDIAKGAGFVRDFNPDVILAVGGGSVMDTAKLLSIMPADEIQIADIIKSGVIDCHKKIPLIVIPTTAGSGSESTHFAVVYIGDEKHSLAGSCLLPDYSIIDPESTYSMPQRLTAITGMDALAQAVESFWAVGGNTESRGYAKESIQLNLQSFEQVVTNPDETSRETMMMAAMLAGKAINISKTTAPHAFSYYLTKKFNIPHGQAVGMLLQVFMHYNATHNKIKGDISEHKSRMQTLVSLFGVNTIAQAIDMVKGMLDTGGISLSFKDLGMTTPSDFNDFMNQVNYERLGNNPVEVEKKALVGFLINFVF